MRKYGKMIIAVILMAVVVVLGTILPSRIFAARDEKRMGYYQSYDTEPIVVQTKSMVPFDKKLDLFYGESFDVQSVNIASTKEEEKKMRKAAKKELKQLFETGALPSELRFMRKEKSSAYRMSKMFVINTSEPEISIHIWLVRVRTAKDKEKSKLGDLLFAIDEESQKILMFQIYSNEFENWTEVERGFSDYLEAESGHYEEKNISSYEEWYEYHALYEGFGVSTAGINQYGFELLQSQEAIGYSDT